MGTTPTYGIYYDDPSMLALGRTQDQKQAVTVEAALSTVAATAEASASEKIQQASEQMQTQMDALTAEVGESIEAVKENSLVPIEAKTPGTYQVGTNFKSFPVISADSLSGQLYSLGVPSANDSRLLVEIEAAESGVYSVGSNFRAIPLTASNEDTSTGGFFTDPTGVKSIKVPVTVGWSQGTSSVPISGAVRYLARWNFPVSRWRIAFRNIDLKTGTDGTASASISGIWVGKHAQGGAFTNAPAKAHGALEVPAGQEAVTPWSYEPLPTGPDGEVMFSVAYTATAMPYISQGYSFISTDSATAGAQAGTGYTAYGYAPFAVTIEVETPITIPVVAVMGDSLSVGYSARRPVLDSAISQWAQPRGAIAIMGGSSGDTAKNSRDLRAYKWTRWASGDKPSALLYTLGTNDFSAGETPEGLLASSTEILEQVKASITPAIFTQYIMPRQDGGATATVQQAITTYNGLLDALPYGEKACWDSRSAVSQDGIKLDADKDSGDRIHLNTAGYTALASSYGRMTAPAPIYNQTW